MNKNRLFAMTTGLLCALTAVCMVLLNMGYLLSIIWPSYGKSGIKADGPTSVLVETGKSLADSRSKKLLYLTTAAAVAGFLMRLVNQIRLERILNNLTKKAS